MGGREITAQEQTVVLYSLYFSADAEHDLIEASDWYEFHRIGLGAELETCVEERLNDIASNPFQFQSRYKSFRVAFVSRFPYGIHYLIDEKTVKVMGIFHMSRDPINWDRP